MSKTTDHEVVSVYDFTDEERDELLNKSQEAVLMWATKDGWPVGVTHAFVWKDGKVWLTFAEHRHRAVAIRRDNRVSVNVSSRAGDGTGPQGAITIKGKGEFFDNDETKAWFYPALAAKVTGGEPEAQKAFESLLDSPLRTILAVTPEKYIMYNATLANRHMRGEVSEDELGKPKSSDAERMNKYRKERGLDERDPEKWEDA